jgi:hypothetical protein
MISRFGFLRQVLVGKKSNTLTMIILALGLIAISQAKARADFMQELICLHFGGCETAQEPKPVIEQKAEAAAKAGIEIHYYGTRTSLNQWQSDRLTRKEIGYPQSRDSVLKLLGYPQAMFKQGDTYRLADNSTVTVLYDGRTAIGQSEIYRGQ